MRSISAAIEAEKNKRANIPIELYQIYLDDVTLYLATWPYPVQFYNEAGQPELYVGAALTRRPIKHSNTLEVDRFRVQLDNVGLDWSGLAANYELQGKKIVIWKIFLERQQGEVITKTGESWEQELDLADTWIAQLDTDESWQKQFDLKSRVSMDYMPIGGFEDRIEMFEGKIDAPTITEQNITVEVTSKLNVLDKRRPGRKYQARCPWVFGDDNCGVDVPENTGTIQSISEDGRTITVENLQDTNWKHGSFKSGLEKRIITSFGNDTVTLEFPVPTNVEVGDSYELSAGCSKAKEDENAGCEFWDNLQFYGGFSSIPEIRQIRG